MLIFSPSEKQFSKQTLLNNLRIDGRAANQRRQIQSKYNILDNLSGSSYTSIDHNKTEVYTGIKLKLSNKAEEHNQIKSNKVILQLSSMKKINQDHQSCLIYMQQLLQEHFINKQHTNFQQLTIKNSKKHFLQMHIQPHLSLLEAIFFSLKKALETTTIPIINCNYNEITGEQIAELSLSTIPLTFSTIDSIAVIGAIQTNYILDLTALQFQSVDTAILILIKGEKIVGFQTIKGAIKYQQIHKIGKFALTNSK